MELIDRLAGGLNKWLFSRWGTMRNLNGGRAETHAGMVLEIEAGIFNATTVLMTGLAIKILLKSLHITPFDIIFLSTSLLGRVISQRALFLNMAIASGDQDIDSAIAKVAQNIFELDLPIPLGFRPIRMMHTTLVWVSPLAKNFFELK